MNLYEFEAKEIFQRRGIPVPSGKVISALSELENPETDFAFPVAVKPQLGVKKRGKAGAILFAEDGEELRRSCSRLFSMRIKGEKARRLLIEEKLEIRHEYYMAVTVDYRAVCPVLLISDQGGVDVEEVAARSPEKIDKFPVEILSGPSEETLDSIEKKYGADFRDIAGKLYGIFRDYDAEMTEINPVVRTSGDELIAVDGVLNVNEDALKRQPEVREMSERHHPGRGELEEFCRERNWTFHALDGSIGILSSGAGLTMAILDIIHSLGGRAANFLDTAQIDGEGMYEAFRLFLDMDEVKVILVNMFAGLNRCDSLAEGTVRFMREHSMKKPVVIRMAGNREKEGRRILEEAGTVPFSRIEEAAAEAVKLSAQ